MAVTTGTSAAPRTAEERLKNIEDWFEIVRTLNQYCRAMDYGRDAHDFTDCFVENGVWWSSVDAPYSGTTGIRLTGHGELAAWYLKNGRDKPEYWKDHLFHKHVYAEPDIRIDGDHATADSYFFTPSNGGASGVYVHSVGRYEDRMVRCPDGRWRFEERHLHREAADPVSQGKPVG